MSVSLHHAILKTYHAQTNALRPSMTEIGLSPGQPKVLRFLTMHESCMQKEIAEALDIEPATVSRIVSNMEQSGLVVRAARGERRRAEAVSITEAGRAAFTRWKKACDEAEVQSMLGFSEEEKLKFIENLCRMYQNLTGRPLE